MVKKLKDLKAKREKEDSYFAEKSRESLERLAHRQEARKPRLSPVTGEPMEEIAIHGVLVDRCKTSGGIWLDAGELELLMEAAKAEAGKDKGGEGWLEGFFRSVRGGK